LVIIDKVGRKKLVYYGVSGMVVSLILIGLYFLFGDSLGVSSLFLLIFFLFYVFCCAVSICAVVFVLLSEMYPTKVRGLAMSIAGFALWIGTYLIGQLTPGCSRTLPRRNILPVRPHVRAIYADCLETRAGDYREVTGGD
ncbi:MFS transporter, partial [Bacteroides sp. CR5/BHMF/2]|nr:MFS transporter [Bacteroides sp. CR5/BHMF/2]